MLVLSIALAAGSLAWRAIGPKMRARNRVERHRQRPADRQFADRHIDHGRHRAFGVVRVDPFLSEDSGDGLSCSAWNGVRRSPCVPTRSVRPGPSARCRCLPDAADLVHRAAGGGADRADVGDLSGGLRRPALRSYAKPVLEVLAGVPTVVYGFFAA